MFLIDIKPLRIKVGQSRLPIICKALSHTKGAKVKTLS